MKNKLKNKSKILGFLFLHITFFIYSLAAVFSKKAGSQNTVNTTFLVCYGMVLVILFVYAILWQQNLKRMSLITAYCNKSVTVIWGLIWGVLLYQEHVKWNQIVGVVIIVLGVLLVAREGEEE